MGWHHQPVLFGKSRTWNWLRLCQKRTSGSVVSGSPFSDMSPSWDGSPSSGFGMQDVGRSHVGMNVAGGLDAGVVWKMSFLLGNFKSEISCSILFGEEFIFNCLCFRGFQVGSLSHYLQSFSTIPGGAGFLPSTVVWVIVFSWRKRAFFTLVMALVVRRFGVTLNQHGNPIIFPPIWGVWKHQKHIWFHIRQPSIMNVSLKQSILVIAHVLRRHMFVLTAVFLNCCLRWSFTDSIPWDW